MFRYVVSILGAIYQVLISVLSRGQTRASSSYEPPSRPPESEGRRQNISGMAIATLVLGIGAWTYLPILGALIGAVIGRMELKNIERGQSPEGGELITKIGFWLSIANIVFVLFGGCVTVALILFVFGSLGALLTEVGVQGLAVM